jgi:hypothetical protein
MFAASTQKALLAALVVASSVAVGCSASPQSQAEHPAAAPDAVTVDFYGASGVSAHCAGTLLSSNVVLTAAHCAEGSRSARVRAPDAGGQTSEVSDVLRYDWGQAQDHTQEHDLALVVLRTPIQTNAFATANADACAGCSAVAFGRNGAVTTKSDLLELDTKSPAGRPFALRFSGSPGGAVGGGAVKAANGSLIGVYMGKGATSSDGYVARIDMAEIQIWMASVISDNGGMLLSTAPQAPVGSVKTSNVQILNTGSGTGSGSSASGSGTGGGTSGSGGDGVGPNSDSDGSNNPSNPDENVQDGAASANDGETPDGEPGPYDPKTQKATKLPPDGQSRTMGNNYWFSADPDDVAFNRDIDYANKHSDATLVGAHGTPGHMTDIPDGKTLKSLTNGKDGPLIVDSCYAGAKGDDGTKSNAAELADNAGLPRSNSYGCVGEETTPNSNTLNCDGGWVDGNGNAVSDSQRQKYGMKNCTVTARNSKGQWIKFSCS